MMKKFLKSKDAEGAPGDAAMTSMEAKFPKPKILLLGIEGNVGTALGTMGFNITMGTFGVPYKVEKSDVYQPLIGEPYLPKHSEKEIIVVDLSYSLRSGPSGEKSRPLGEPDYWGKCDKGFVDPRPRGARYALDAFDRILENGGVFIVFSAPRTEIEVIMARREGGIYGGLVGREDVNYDAWGFLSQLKYTHIADDHGEEIKMVGSRFSSLDKLLDKHLPESEFTCTIHTFPDRDNPWEVLAENKFGQAVAVHKGVGANGHIIVVPQMHDKTSFLKSLFSEVLPEIAPHLFPHIVRGAWTREPEIELSRVLELENEKKELLIKFEEEIVSLDRDIESERAESGWLHELLTETGDPLVGAVITALRHVGFENVVDVDEEMKQEGKENSLREDLRIDDGSPILIVDVKGVGGHPSDSEAFQSHKHATIRMKEWKRFDVRAVTVINHQRHMPPLSRDNSMPYRKEILDYASEVGMGLMTTWDLFRMCRGRIKNGWSSDDLKPRFCEDGRISVFPTCYRRVGRVGQVWKNAFSILVEEHRIKVGDRICVEFPVEFEEFVVSSLRLSDSQVELANIGSEVGVPREGLPGLRGGYRVYVVDEIELS